MDNSGPIVDMGFNFWVAPPQVDCNANPSDASCQVAAVTGVPSGKCTQSDGADSLPVGANLGSVNKDGTTTIRSVIDVNQVNAALNPQIINSTTVVSGWVAVGWIYLDNNGALWFQRDPLAQWQTSFTVNLNAYFGVSVAPPAGQNPVYIKTPPTLTPITDNLQTVKCFTKGRALVPGTYGVASSINS